MENLRYKNAAGLTLVADYCAVAQPKAVVILAHGMTSDRRAKGRFVEVAKHLNNAGYNTLAFDFSGCGESDDRLITPQSLLSDLQSTLDYAKGFGLPLVVWGHSLGSITSLRAYTPDIVTMVLTGGGAGQVAYDWDKLLSAEQLQSWREKGEVLYPSSSNWRSHIRLSAAILENFGQFDAPAILGRIQSPVLLINGDDEEEQLLSATVARGMPHLPAGSRHVIIPGMGHSLTGHLDEVIELGLDWLEQRFN